MSIQRHRANEISIVLWTVENKKKNEFHKFATNAFDWMPVQIGKRTSLYCNNNHNKYYAFNPFNIFYLVCHYIYINFVCLFVFIFYSFFRAIFRWFLFLNLSKLLCGKDSGNVSFYRSFLWYCMLWITKAFNSIKDFTNCHRFVLPNLIIWLKWRWTGVKTIASITLSKLAK